MGQGGLPGCGTGASSRDRGLGGSRVCPHGPRPPPARHEEERAVGPGGGATPAAPPGVGGGEQIDPPATLPRRGGVSLSGLQTGEVKGHPSRGSRLRRNQHCRGAAPHSPWKVSSSVVAMMPPRRRRTPPRGTQTHQVVAPHTHPPPQAWDPWRDANRRPSPSTTHVAARQLPAWRSLRNPVRRETASAAAEPISLPVAFPAPERGPGGPEEDGGGRAQAVLVPRPRRKRGDGGQARGVGAAG